MMYLHLFKYPKINTSCLIFNFNVWFFCLVTNTIMKDDVLLYDYNVQERVNDFVAAAMAQTVKLDMNIETDLAYELKVREWPYIQNLCHQEVNRRRRHTHTLCTSHHHFSIFLRSKQ